MEGVIGEGEELDKLGGWFVWVIVCLLWEGLSEVFIDS